MIAVPGRRSRSGGLDLPFPPFGADVRWHFRDQWLDAGDDPTAVVLSRRNSSCVISPTRETAGVSIIRYSTSSIDRDAPLSCASGILFRRPTTATILTRVPAW
jgi:hypothetical protein